MKPLPRWGNGGIVGRDDPSAVLSIALDGKDVSQIALFGVELTVNDGDNQRFLGVGSVWTASRYRRRGFAARLLENAFAFAQIHHTMGTCLFSLGELVAYYRKCGYVEMTGPKEMMQPADPEPKYIEVPDNVHFLIRTQHTLLGTESVVIRSLPW